MQFVDEARFVVRAGRGGDGSVSFNRQKYKPRGGPDGGRGGDGGDVVLRSTEDLSTLEPHAYRNVVKAGRGGHGSSNNRAGERGKDAVLEVPVGTQVFDDDGLLADLSEPGETFAAAAGGELGVRVHVEGQVARDITEPGTEVLTDLLRDAGRDVTFVEGLGDLIDGYEQGVIGMRNGGTRRLIIPPELGYGSEPQRNSAGEIIIPANSTLVYDIEVFNVAQ